MLERAQILVRGVGFEPTKACATGYPNTGVDLESGPLDLTSDEGGTRRHAAYPRRNTPHQTLPIDPRNITLMWVEAFLRP